MQYVTTPLSRLKKPFSKSQRHNGKFKRERAAEAVATVECNVQKRGMLEASPFSSNLSSKKDCYNCL
jgi:hypothetical protein